MEQSQLTGVFIMIGATLQMILFLWAIARRSYMALALPVMVALAAISALAFWIGWTMFTTEPELEEGLEEEEEALP